MINRYLRMQYEWRKAGYNTKTFARAVGMSESAFYSHMSGRTQWSLADAIRISKLLGSSIEELFEVEK